MPKTISIGDREVVTALTGEDLQKLLRAPLGRLRISTPSLNECEELAPWAGPGPFGSVERTQYISAQPHRYLTSLKNSLNEVEAFHSRVLEFALEKAKNEKEKDLIIQNADREMLGPIRRLREALTECDPLCRQNPLPYEESWQSAAQALSMVFGWVIERSGSNVRAGLAKDGPAMSFIWAGLELQGWRKGRNPTQDAVLQHLKRTRQGRDK